MWNISRSIGQMAPVMGPLKTQKRDFASINLSSVAIAPGKSFRNPNFVNDHPNVHRCHPVSAPVQKVRRNSDADVAKLSGRKRCKKVRKNKNCRKQINEMMEIDEMRDISMSPKAPILDVPSKMNDEVFAVVSISPPSNRGCRPRELSVCESEDSFIVFDSGTDEELKFSDSDDTELDTTDDDDTDSDVDDDIDSSLSVLPCKRVRFAENEDLCEVHPMVQWSYAYRNARKGPWEEYARDRERFSKRIKNTEAVLGPIFDGRHRDNVYKERFDDGR